MEGLRVVTVTSPSPLEPCCRCGAAGCAWDRVAGQPLCPDCQESLALCKGEALVVRAENQPCAVCSRRGTVRFLTFPLQGKWPVEIDLCGEHLRALLARRLGPAAYWELCRKLAELRVRREQVFLLHEAFYDGKGQPLQPIPPPFYD
jgi:hypothetical protein